MSGDFEGNATELIPADVRMISGCKDAQTSGTYSTTQDLACLTECIISTSLIESLPIIADVSNVSSFQLPNSDGSGGACTSALLKVLNASTPGQSSFVEVLTSMRQVLSSGRYTQIPQLSASRKMNVREPFQIVPESVGTKRALLIGINYVGQQGQLSGCHNDVARIKEYLMEREGFRSANIHILMDDGAHENPTHANILAAFAKLTNATEPGDAAFFHYSGHGGRVEDDDGDEEDGYDETLIPVDFQSAGQIRDDTIFVELVGNMPKGSTLTCLMDCCHSGSILDLPYTFKADGEQDEMGVNPNANMDKLKKMAISFLVSKLLGPGPVASVVTMVLVNLLTGPNAAANLAFIKNTVGSVCASK